MAEAIPTTRRKLFAIATVTAVATTAPAAQASTSAIEAHGARLKTIFDNYEAWVDDDYDGRWQDLIRRTDRAIADHPCDSPRSAVIKLEHLIRPALSGTPAGNLDEQVVLDQVIAFLRTL